MNNTPPIFVYWLINIGNVLSWCTFYLSTLSNHKSYEEMDSIIFYQ